MAITTLNLEVQKMAYIDESNPDTHYTLNHSTWYRLSESGAGTTVLNRQMLFSLAALSSSLKHNKLYGIQFAFFVSAEYFDECVVYPNYGTFNEDTVTYNTQPTLVKGYNIALRSFSSNYQGDIFAPSTIKRDTDDAYKAYRALSYASLRLMGGYLDKTMRVRTVLSGGSSPYAVVTYDDAAIVKSKITYRSGPASGYFNPREPAVFTWVYTKANSNEYCASPFWSQRSATFYWKTSDSTLHSISAGTDTTLTVPANTFPVNDSITWYVIGEDEDGTTTSLLSKTFSTSAGAASATPISPSGSIEDGSAPIRFSWNLSSSDGQYPTRVEGQWRQQGAESWTALFNLLPAEESFEASSGTFPAGQIEWRVRAYNIDDTAGEWAAAAFIVHDAPPPVSGLAATNVPRTTISWQSSSQEAYEISIDGVVVQKDIGPTTTSWQAAEPLSDRTHEIQVRVQGVYGLWSQPSSIFVEINNTPETTITLNAQFGTDALLAADAGQISEATAYQWYRDGVRIGSSKTAMFTDRFVLGSHRYYVEIWHDSGNYSRSNEVSGLLSVRGTWIALFSGGGWLNITLTDKATSVQQYTHSSVISSRHITGAKFPAVERSTYQDTVGSYSCAFRDPAAAEALEAMKGQMVIVKSRKEKTVIGCLAELAGTEYFFYTAYSFTLQQAEWEDFVTDEDD